MDDETLYTMHELVNLSAAERHRLVLDFVDGTFGTVDANPTVVELLRSTMPDLPAEPTTEQVTAWMDLVAPVRDETFRPPCAGWPNTRRESEPRARTPDFITS